MVQVTTPILFKLVPALVKLGVLMHWFPSESATTNEVIFFRPMSHMSPSPSKRVHCMKLIHCFHSKYHYLSAILNACYGITE